MSGLEVTMMKRIGELNAEVKYLQDKVERLTAEVSYDKRVQLHVDKLAAEFTQWEVERLKAEVERLRKAGDAMAQEIIGCYRAEGYDPADSESLRAWRAAKEGRPNE